jgi:hypothetical protein
MGRVMQGLVSDLATDPTLGQAFRDHVIALRLAELRHLVQRGVERGQIRPDIDLELLHELLFGPVYHRLLLTGSAFPGDFARRVVDAVYPSLENRSERAAPQSRPVRAPHSARKRENRPKRHARGGTTQMAGIQKLDFDSPDETRAPEKTRADIVRVGPTTAARYTFQPGWRWSECIKPVAGTDSCQVRHVGVAGSGRLTVKHDDGTEVEFGAGDAYVIEPGHDAWVVGDEPFVAYEFETQAAEAYGRG